MTGGGRGKGGSSGGGHWDAADDDDDDAPLTPLERALIAQLQALSPPSPASGGPATPAQREAQRALERGAAAQGLPVSAARPRASRALHGASGPVRSGARPDRVIIDRHPNTGVPVPPRGEPEEISDEEEDEE